MPSSEQGYLVPDLLQPHLQLVLVGTAPSHRSAAARAYYANPQNKFWHMLHAAGLTPRLLQPSEYPELLHFGIGLTDVAKRHSGVDAALPADAWAPAELLGKLQLHQPQIVAFTSKRGASEVLGLPTGRLPYGQQSPEVVARLGLSAPPELWVLPSTSPLGHNHFSAEPWEALGARVHRLRGKPGD
ncbi:mismatch-specific DNA-glycosylase [Deinococcus lacus]|uniref:Mismatch-specific DNA-glycosylase n=1 Tax=Deinococcus lacus TaxID=392561 RepID=A0ABW1YDL4_9DEIO